MKGVKISPIHMMLGVFLLIALSFTIFALWCAVDMRGVVRFITSWGVSVVTGLYGAIFASVATYLWMWWRTFRLLEIFSITKGTSFFGFIEEGPMEVNIRDVICPSLDDANVTLVRASQFAGKGEVIAGVMPVIDILFPVSSITGGWEKFTAPSVWRVVKFLGEPAPIDEFLAEVYGLDLDDPADRERLVDYLRKIDDYDPTIPTRYMFVIPIGERETVESIARHTTPEERGPVIEAVAKTRRYYVALIFRLIFTFRRALGNVYNMMRTGAWTLAKEAEVEAKTLADPLKLTARMLGVPAEKIKGTGLSLGEQIGAREMMQMIKEYASEVGHVVVPKEEWDYLVRRVQNLEKFQEDVMSGKIAVEIEKEQELGGGEEIEEEEEKKK